MKKVQSKRTRYILALLLGISAAIITAALGQWTYMPLVSWDAAALAIIVIITIDMHKATARATATAARRDDMHHSLSDVVVLTASLASIGAVVYLLAGKETSMLHIGFGLMSIVISWTTVHLLYALRYAAIYYRDVEGGIDFAHPKPRFTDFLYLAFTLGMTYQVSDTTLQTSEFRKVALGHAVLSFIFGTTIIATTINFLASLSK